jgi:hypothetical protein
MFSPKRDRVRRLLLIIATGFVCLLVVAQAAAQTVTGTLQGTVSDAKGDSVSGADVVVRSVETGAERNLKTNSEGFYIASFLPIGKYTVTATVKGFKTTSREGIEITLNQTRVVDFALEISSVT